MDCEAALYCAQRMRSLRAWKLRPSMLLMAVRASSSLKKVTKAYTSNLVPLLFRLIFTSRIWPNSPKSVYKSASVPAGAKSPMKSVFQLYSGIALFDYCQSVI